MKFSDNENIPPFFLQHILTKFHLQISKTSCKGQRYTYVTFNNILSNHKKYVWDKFIKPFKSQRCAFCYEKVHSIIKPRFIGLFRY